MLRKLSQIRQIIIHCSASPNGKNFGVLDIDRWHEERGFNRDPKAIESDNEPAHVGYHYVINLNGELQVGRTLAEVGAHARGNNYDSIGICLIGTDKYSRHQWQALHDAVNDLESSFRIERVIGHNDVYTLKTCPGFNVELWNRLERKPLTGHILEVPRG